ncbi:acetyltransferase [Paenibacillus segetis]|uniref:Acetyltransferase n=2 Tax=Paenibacillus segetis TaxID=1325360 RepID=A0ABQ1YDV4_9BACL|nr:acetyltransferase [Paenibacillus segetis]
MENMGNEIQITTIDCLVPSLVDQFSDLLIRVVEDGASIGFLPPLSMDEAVKYWNDVIEPGVILWAAVLNDTLVGTVQLQLAQKQNARHRAEIAKLMVHPQYRRKGIAQLLMQAAEDQARMEGRSLLILDTRAGDPSNKLYLSLDYIEAGRIPNFAQSADGTLHETVLYYKKIGQ